MLSVFRIVALGLWVGAMAGFAFLFAPIAFTHIGPTPAFASTIAASVRAITTAGNLLGILAVVATLVLRESPRTKAAVIGCVALAIFFGSIETSLIVPEMQNTPLLTPAYESLHRQSSGVYAAVLVCALGALVVSSRSRYT